LPFFVFFFFYLAAPTRRRLRRSTILDKIINTNRNAVQAIKAAF
jgi:hypothetical protein